MDVEEQEGIAFNMYFCRHLSVYVSAHRVSSSYQSRFEGERKGASRTPCQG